MNMITGILVIVVLVIVYVVARRSGSSKAAHTSKKVRPEARRSGSAKSDTSFHAVSLRFPSSACEAAKAMRDERFLSNAAPRLPLPDCDVQTCKCRFVHHKDRRAGDDRRDTYGQGFGGGSTGEHEEEQRKSGERRDDPPDSIF
jgi:hypothetical protein